MYVKNKKWTVKNLIKGVFYMAKKFEIIKKKNLPDNAQITGQTFLKEPSEKDKEKRTFDFISKSNDNEIGCYLLKNKKFGFTKGYVRVDETQRDYIEVKSRFIFIILLLILMIILCLFLRSCGTDSPVTPSINKPIFDLTPDKDAQTGALEGKTTEELQEELNRKVAEGMMNISMNLNPVFADGESAGNLLIMNESINRYPQIIEIYKKDTNELVYKSGLIPVGSRVDTGKLLVDLDAGEYSCVAYFNAVDSETGELKGKAGAEIIITVKN